MYCFSFFLHFICPLFVYLIYLLTEIGLTTGDSNTVHIYTQTIHRTTKLTTFLEGFLGFEPRVVKLIALKISCNTEILVVV